MQSARRLVLIKKMPELKWNEYDFVECLGVLPEIDDYNTGHHFKVERNDLILEMSVWQHESLIALSLYQTEKRNSFLTVWFVVRGKIQYINDKRGSFLEFNDFFIVKNRGYYIEEGDVFEEPKFPMKLNIELTIEPEISFRIV